MNITAKDIMERSFLTVQPDMTIGEAMTVFRRASEATGRRVFGLMVTDYREQLVGMLSMYDIFLLIRPKHIHIWGEMKDLDLTGMVSNACQKAGRMLVGDIMTTELITIPPDTHLLYIIDIMLKKHVRRIPVVEAGRILGIVYISRVFDCLLENFQTVAA
ncbi:MAG: CBS domain-containing protein [Desulfobacca sp.]|uniref:CBS domain-containing protein n=1 Tax=Desulfobacca sp. TaxID=2067990 RepID=UPI004049839F